MKKIRFLALAAFVCTAGYLGYTAYDKATMTDQERLIRANIEALTDGENNSNTLSCFKGVYDSGQDGYVLLVRYCSSCTNVFAERAWDSSYCDN